MLPFRSARPVTALLATLLLVAAMGAGLFATVPATAGAALTITTFTLNTDRTSGPVAPDSAGQLRLYLEANGSYDAGNLVGFAGPACTGTATTIRAFGMTAPDTTDETFSYSGTDVSFQASVAELVTGIRSSSPCIGDLSTPPSPPTAVLTIDGATGSVTLVDPLYDWVIDTAPDGIEAHEFFGYTVADCAGTPASLSSGISGTDLPTSVSGSGQIGDDRSFKGTVTIDGATVTTNCVNVSPPPPAPAPVLTINGQTGTVVWTGGLLDWEVDASPGTIAAHAFYGYLTADCSGQAEEFSSGTAGNDPPTAVSGSFPLESYRSFDAIVTRTGATDPVTTNCVAVTVGEASPSASLSASASASISPSTSASASAEESVAPDASASPSGAVAPSGSASLSPSASSSAVASISPSLDPSAVASIGPSLDPSAVPTGRPSATPGPGTVEIVLSEPVPDGTDVCLAGFDCTTLSAGAASTADIAPVAGADLPAGVVVTFRDVPAGPWLITVSFAGQLLFLDEVMVVAGEMVSVVIDDADRVDPVASGSPLPSSEASASPIGAPSGGPDDASDPAAASAIGSGGGTIGLPSTGAGPDPSGPGNSTLLALFLTVLAVVVVGGAIARRRLVIR